jgi:hypothetical protein
MNKKAAFWVIAVPLIAMIGAPCLLTAVFGPTDNGLVCTRDSVRSECEIRQTRFFGLIGNSSVSVPESSIRGAKAKCGSRPVGGHASPSCSVYLTIEGAQEYPVLSYVVNTQADSAAEKLNVYFRDASARSIEIDEDAGTPVLVFGVGPIVLVTLVFVFIRNWKSRRVQTATVS